MRRRSFLAAGLAAFLPGRIRAQDDQPPPQPAPRLRSSIPSDASWHAAKDAAQLRAIDRPFQRYIWVRDQTVDTAAAVSFVLNTAVSTSSTIQLPTPVAGGLLLRMDIRSFCPLPTDSQHFADVWEKMSSRDPWFHADSFIVTKVQVKPYVASDDKKTYDYVYKRTKQFGLGADVNSLLTLRTLLGTDLPIVDASWMLGQMLTTVDGGLYYEFRGINKSKDKAKTDLDLFLEARGASAKSFGERASDEKAAIIHSKVTGKPRVVVVFFGTNARPSSAIPLISITLDVQNGDIDHKQDPLRNLIRFNSRASEVIGVMPNGMLIYGLFNNKGERQDAVPDVIARDGTVPFPHDPRLQPGLGCIRCHGPEDGWKPFENDAKTGFNEGIVFGGDFEGQAKRSQSEVLEQIRSLYTGELGPVIGQARTAHAVAAYRATGGLYGTKSVSTVSATIGRLYQEYFLDLVSPAKACAELGYPLPDDATPQQARDEFKKLVPLLPGKPGETRQEDIAVGLLRAGLSLNRFQWEHIFQDCLLRSGMARIAKDAGKEPPSEQGQ